MYFSMMYSRADLYLMVKIERINNLPHHYSQFRLSAALLPTKKWRAKTKHQTLDKRSSGPSAVRQMHFNETFKFCNADTELLFSSALRIRLYGQTQVKRERPLGEIKLHFADVTATAVGFSSSRKFEDVVSNKRR